MPGGPRAPRGGAISDHFDLKEILSSQGAAGAAPLDLYAKLVGLPGKEDVAGADVQALYAEGARDRIAAYCMTDVVQTFLLFLRHRLVEGSLTPDGYADSVAMARDALPSVFARRLPQEQREVLAGFVERCRPFFDGDRIQLRAV
jgi:predicted PolB exonuclease-like 3'-5' exonuclease